MYGSNEKNCEEITSRANDAKMKTNDVVIVISNTPGVLCFSNHHRSCCGEVRNVKVN
jgi:hypothetical protein